MKLATADGRALTLFLRQITKAPRNLLGAAFWSFGEELIVRWTSYEQPVEAHVETPVGGPIMVPGKAMNQLGAIVDLEGETQIGWDAERGRLRVGIHSLPATMMDSEPTFSLAVDAEEKDLLKEMTKRSYDEVEGAGHIKEMNEALERWSSSIQAASEALAWTGMTREAIEVIIAEAIRSDLERTTPEQPNGPFSNNARLLHRPK